MTFPGLMKHPVEIVKPGVKESRAGDLIKDWSTATRTASACWVWTQKAFEDEALTDESKMRVVLFFPKEADIDNEDQIEMAGHTYRVSGPPMPKYTLRGLHHWEVEAEGEF